MKTEKIVIGAAREADLPGIIALLDSCGLADDDVGAHLRHFLVAREENKIVGTVGAEANGPDALLRSLAVAAAYRHRGVADALLRQLAAAAESWGVDRWWLLTTTAKEYFEARGFTVASRCSAPAAIQRTRQFSGGCGDEATCLTRERKESR